MKYPLRIIPLKKNFFRRDAEEVGRSLLGKYIIRKIGRKILRARIVETEAYYGLKDPSSRAFRTPKMAQSMWFEGGVTFVYMVHNNWLLNIISGKKGDPQAVLIRALEPLSGIKIMEKNRGKKGYDLTNGPGKLTQALKLDKESHNLRVYNNRELFIADSLKKFKIECSNRIGVKRDLKKKLRFFIKDNRWVSKGKVLKGVIFSTARNP